MRVRVGWAAARERIPDGFDRVGDGDSTLVMRSDVRGWLEPLLRALGRPGALPFSTRSIAGGRGGVTLVSVDEHRVIVRACRRGGLPAWFLRDVYCGRRPRPLRELAAAATLRARGAPVVEAYAVKVQWVLPICYRGWMVTRYLPGAQTLWQWAAAAPLAAVPLAAVPPAAERALVLAQVGRAIRRLHDCGGSHPDLNVNNILIRPAAGASTVPEVVLIDFDRARVGQNVSLSAAADVARLRRSVRKLDPRGVHLTTADLSAVEAAYAEGGA